MKTDTANSTDDRHNPARENSRIAATIVWMSDQPLLVGSRYLIHCGSSYSYAIARSIVGVLAPETNEWRPADTLQLQQWGLVELEAEESVPASGNDKSASFTMLDPITERTIAAGTLACFSADEERAVALIDCAG